MNYQSQHEVSPGSSAWDCGLPKTPRMVYWPASADLSPYISGYHLYAVGASGDAPQLDAFQPAWANLRLVLSGGAGWRVRPVRGEWSAPGPVSLFGPSSTLIWSESGAGIVVGAGIRPRGWPRLFERPAREWADRIGDAPALGTWNPGALHARFCALDEDDAIPQAFEALFREIMRPSPADDAAIGRIEAALVDPSIGTVGDLAATAHLSIRTLERLTHRAFGFPPKLLLRRARFLRSLHAVRAACPGERATAIDPAYTDYSHFIRDSHDFLGVPPQTFLELDLPLFTKSLSLRKQVLGAPAQALAAVASKHR